MRRPKLMFSLGWPRWARYLSLALVGLWLTAIPTLAKLPSEPSRPALVVTSSLQQGQALYEAGQLTEAAQILQQVAETAQQQGRPSEAVMAYRNLALVYQQLGRWDQANGAINQGLQLLERVPGAKSQLLASILTVQGSLQLDQGQARTAVTTWEQASKLYDQLGDSPRAMQNRVNQAQALQRIGFYRRSLDLLLPIVQTLTPQPDSLLKAVALRNLGDGLQVMGELEEARKQVEASLEIAQRLGSQSAIVGAQVSLANILHSQGKTLDALNLYQQVATTSSPGPLQLQAQMNQIKILIELDQTAVAEALLEQVQTRLEQQPPNHTTVFARINLAQSLLKLDEPREMIVPLLTTAIRQARTLQDVQAESYGIGLLGQVYEKSGQWNDARQLSEQALLLAQTNQLPDIAYRWQWQLGRIFRAQASQGQPEFYSRAIAAYTETLTTLQTLRPDLVAASAEVQLSFQDSVDPIHRELVSLLLDPQRGEANPEDLAKALTVVESLQLAELDNFFREACLRAMPVQIDQVDQQAAVIYPILLDDRLEVIVSLPGQHLKHYTSPVSRPEAELTIDQLRQSLVFRPDRRFLAGSQKVYDWIVRPAAAELASSQIKTLVFILDGALRNLPMAALHDGQQFLVEKYSVALTPGLQLLSPQRLQPGKLSVLTAGLSESRQGFSALPNVVSEVKEIQSTIPAKVLLNQEFTRTAFKQALSSQPAPIVHLATHGKFSSTKEGTFILTWDDRLNITTLNQVLQLSDLNKGEPIELLVLSACETATGDRLAALGMAGMAVRAGARSTIASLWQINDQATALLMNHLYENLAKGKMTKAEALRQAQLKILQDPRLRHPYFWAPYVLVGNWL